MSLSAWTFLFSFWHLWREQKLTSDTFKWIKNCSNICFFMNLQNPVQDSIELECARSDLKTYILFFCTRLIKATQFLFASETDSDLHVRAWQRVFLCVWRHRPPTEESPGASELGGNRKQTSTEKKKREKEIKPLFSLFSLSFRPAWPILCRVSHNRRV